jgi:predicted amidohydrolase
MRADVVVQMCQIEAAQCWADRAHLEQNAANIRQWYERVADESDLVVFPELSLTGYIPLKGYDQAKKLAMAEVAGAATTDVLPRLAGLTQGRRAAMVVGLMEATDMRFEFFNTAAYLEDGEILGTYRKIHLPVEENHYFVPGDRISVFQSRIGCVGLSICYDLLFPEVGRMAALAGAELLCVVSNWLRIGNLPRLAEYLPAARALENQYHVVFVNGVGELEVRGRRWPLFGGSRAVTAAGEVVACAGDGEEQARVELTDAALADGHQVFPVLRDRRPEVYGTVVASPATFAAHHREG